METTIEAIVSLVGLLLGGGAGAFFTWRYQKKKAKVEAQEMEQDYYRRLIEDIEKDRDYYKAERNELRGRLDTIDEQMRTMRNEYSREKVETDRKIAQLGRRVETMRPFLCGDLTCKRRQLVTLSEQGENSSISGDDVEPLENTVL